MGYARIIGGGPNGRYSIELDYGSDTKSALLAALSALLARIDSAIAAQLVLIADADAKEAAQVLLVQSAQAEIIASMAGGLPPGSPRADTAGFNFQMQQLAVLRKRHAPLRLKLDALKFDRAQALRKVAYWTSFNPVETRNAWCADLTEEAPAGAYAATVDLPGESNLILLAPGCRGWSAGDGLLTAREVMSPAQAFLNAAILPGWQRWKPTYRWGTCTALDEDADTMSVALASQPSSAQGLGINQVSTLTGVPVVYMSCNAKAFEVGDRVIVQFINRDWQQPRVIGFLDNPKPCELFTLVYLKVIFGISSTTLSTQEVYKNRDADEVTTSAPYYAGGGLGGAQIFFGWDDGVPSLSRQELSVDESDTFTAQYLSVSGFDFLSGGIGFRTESNPPLEDVTTYKRVAVLSYPSWLTVTSGLAEGEYDSGWLATYAEAYSYLVGSTLTGTVTHLGQVITLTFSVQVDSSNPQLLDMALTGASPLYAL